MSLRTVQNSRLADGAKIDNLPADTVSALNGKQATLISGTNIKTINGTPLLGSGDLVISGAGTVTNVSSANADISIANPTTTPTLTLNSSETATASTIVKRDTSGSASVNTAKFSLTPTGTPTTGELYWDTVEETLSFPMNANTTMNIGQEMYVKIVNKTGVQINDGQAVYLSGAQGNRPTATLARANASTTSFMIGVATENIANNAEGLITVYGLIHNYNTTGFTAGDILYVSDSTAGGITNVAPTSPNYSVILGRAMNSTVNGTIGVFPQQPIANDIALGDLDNMAPCQKAVKTYANMTPDFYKYSISRTIVTNNIVVALKNYEGNDPTVAKPVKIQIGGTIFTITAAMSITRAAGTNYFNSGSSELATKEIDYFVYIRDNVTQSKIDIIFGRIPNAVTDAEFSTTSTNEKFATTVTGTNNITNIGRFNATLSAGAGYTWSIPATSTIINSATFSGNLVPNAIPRVNKTTSITTSVTMDAFSYDLYDITAQAGALLFNKPAISSPYNGQKLMVRIKDNGTSRSLTYGAGIASGAGTLPTTTTISKKTWIGLMYDSTDDNWLCLASGTQP